jgi:hypothetical protein
LEKVVDKLKLSLVGDLDQVKKKVIETAMALIQGENYGSYVRPSLKELGDAAKALHSDLRARIPETHVITMERVSLEAIKSVDPAWVRNVFLDSVPEFGDRADMELLTNWALCAKQTKTGHRDITTASYFIAMAENVTTKSRFSSVKAYLTCMDFLAASGNISAEAVDKMRPLMQSFLMGLEFGNDK